ncbi:MAG: putative transcriptional regulator, partial [Candidatus Atelocyanobacterium thalassa isolate SIO64986]
MYSIFYKSKYFKGMYPEDGETLAMYVKRCRILLKLTQSEMAKKVNINTQSLGKIESGKTQSLNSKTRIGLAEVLNVPETCIDAICRGVKNIPEEIPKICPQCWFPGHNLETMWLEKRAKYCFLCGSV